MSFFDSCSAEQLQALKAAQSFRGEGVRLKDLNPYDPSFDGTAGGESVRTFLEGNYPEAAAAFKSSAEGYSKSIDAVLFDRGLTDLTPAIHAEKMGTDVIYRKQKEAEAADFEKRMLAEMESAADKAYEARTGNDASDRDRPNFAQFGKMASAVEQRWIHEKLMSD